MPYVKGGHNDKIFPWKKYEGYPNPKDIRTQTNPEPKDMPQKTLIKQEGAKPETCTKGTQTDSKPMTTDIHTQTDEEDYNTQIETNPSSANVQRVNPNAENAATQTKAKNQDIKTNPKLKYSYGKIIIQNITYDLYIISSCSCSS